MLASVSTIQDLPPTAFGTPLKSTRSAPPVGRELDIFNLVLVIDTPPDKHLSNHLGIYYRDIIVKLAAAVKHEELHTGWLSIEAVKVVELREQAREKGKSSSFVLQFGH